MVLELLINPRNAERRPWKMLFVGILYSSVAILLSLWVFPEQSSLVMVFITVLASIHIVHSVIKIEEAQNLSGEYRMLIKEHGPALSFFMFLFLGYVISFSVWYVATPAEITTTLFSVQQDTISRINSQVTGSFAGAFPMVGRIFFNNIRVMVFCILFSFAFGAGAIFILAWNASVISTAIGSFASNSLHQGILPAFTLALLRYLTHGIPEILAYFMAGLAGGIISIAIIRHEWGSERFTRVLLDSVDLSAGAVAMLFAAALVEVYVTPALF
ncbi:TPA: stage II sporulation protein M [Candidatus Woesearchaeota archaeon]|nr:stage II sporulation protein M [Candidatus Woesearchaeota archaeon]HII69079.1 stage II sporulation protein M [Candidatus Woesearchaeota archaeon]